MLRSGADMPATPPPGSTRQRRAHSEHGDAARVLRILYCYSKAGAHTHTERKACPVCSVVVASSSHDVLALGALYNHFVVILTSDQSIYRPPLYIR